MQRTIKAIQKTYAVQAMLGLLGVLVGAVVGVLDVGFGKGLLYVSSLRTLHPWMFLPFLPLAGVLIAACYRRFGGKSSKGMNLVFAAGHGEEAEIPLRLIPLVVGSTWLTHLFGGSAGREGVAVQIGATVSHWVGRHLSIKDASRIFLVVGMSAGFAGLFQTPFAAILFGMEVLAAKELRSEALIPTLTASITAAMVSHRLGLEKFTVALTNSVPLDAVTLLKLTVLGVVFGVVGGLFAWLLKQAKQWAVNFWQSPLMRIAVMGVGLSIAFLLLGQGRYSGLGTNLIEACFAQQPIYAWDWALKLLLTVLTLAAGFQGGEVTPLFSIGACLGSVLAGLVGLPVPVAAALGYAAVFGGASNTLLAPMLIGAEVFGFSYLPCFFVVCAVAYVFNANQCIYPLQRRKSEEESQP